MVTMKIFTKENLVSFPVKAITHQLININLFFVKANKPKTNVKDKSRVAATSSPASIDQRNIKIWTKKIKIHTQHYV